MNAKSGTTTIKKKVSSFPSPNRTTKHSLQLPFGVFPEIGAVNRADVLVCHAVNVGNNSIGIPGKNGLVDGGFALVAETTKGNKGGSRGV